MRICIRRCWQLVTPLSAPGRRGCAAAAGAGLRKRPPRPWRRPGAWERRRRAKKRGDVMVSLQFSRPLAFAAVQHRLAPFFLCRHIHTLARVLALSSPAAMRRLPRALALAAALLLAVAAAVPAAGASETVCADGKSTCPAGSTCCPRDGEPAYGCCASSGGGADNQETRIEHHTHTHTHKQTEKGLLLPRLLLGHGRAVCSWGCVVHRGQTREPLWSALRRL